MPMIKGRKRGPNQGKLAGSRYFQPCEDLTEKRLEAGLQSPLRYPGGKRRLAEYIGEVLKINEIRPKLFVEPFAGGASVSLNLLSNGLVDKIAIGEKDPLVAAFWKVVFDDPDWLIHKVETTPITVGKWKEMKMTREGDLRERAFACLFLNRTSFSGILHPNSGPIGGKKQISPYKIDCRFPTKRLVQQIRDIHSLGPKVEFIHEGDWMSTMQRAKELEGYAADDLFYYLDPPFYNKADRLYQFSFEALDHVRLCKHLSRVKSPWLVSYDPAEAIIEMYSNNGFSARTIHVLYSTSADGNRMAREIILTNLRTVPERTKMWSSGRCR